MAAETSQQVLSEQEGTEYSAAGFNSDMHDGLLGVGYFVPGNIDVETLVLVAGEYSVELKDS